MSTLSSIIEGLETRLLTIEGLSVSRYSPAEVTPPHVAIGVPAVSEYRSTMGRGYWTPAPTLTLFTSAADHSYGQLLMAAMAEPSGANSIVAAIEGDRTLGGAVADCVVVSFEPQGLEAVGSVECFVGQFTLLCAATGA